MSENIHRVAGFKEMIMAGCGGEWTFSNSLIGTFEGVYIEAANSSIVYFYA